MVHMRLPKIMVFAAFLCAFGAFAFAAEPLFEIPKDDDTFLEIIERKAFDYFWNEANPKTGLVYDGSGHHMQGSIASVGFALSAICVADSRGWVSHEDAYQRVLTTLKSFEKDPSDPNDLCAEGAYGLFYHFVDVETGKWYKNNDCVSTADTADLIAGVITCMEYFKGTEVERIGERIVRACEWDRFLLDNKGRRHRFLAMGYLPPGKKSSWNKEEGFFGRYYGYNDNSFLIYLLAIASPTHPIPVSSWYACQATYKWQTYKGSTVIATSPPGLAFHYYHHCWLDLKGKKDQVADYFRNTRDAILAQVDYCATTGFYADGLWGLSSCIAPRGYEALGAPFGDVNDNGTMTPHAVAGAIVFTPDIALETMKYLSTTYGGLVMGRYGLVDAYNQMKGWVARSYLGIDEGVIVLMVENFRSRLIWKYFMRNRSIREALKKIGFVGVIADFEEASPAVIEVASGNALAVATDESVIEGRRSLKLSPQGDGKVTVVVKSELMRPAGFRYLALWTKNASDVTVEIAGTAGRWMPCERVARTETGGWTRSFYALNAAASVGTISGARLTLLPVSGGAPSFIDGLFLMYAMPEKDPAPVADLAVTPVAGLAAARVSFRSSDGAHHYDIRYAERPIVDWDAFDRARRSALPTITTGAKAEEFFVTFPDAGTYYCAVAAVGPTGERSALTGAGPVAIPDRMSSLLIDDFERSSVSGGPVVSWPGHAGYTLTIAQDPAGGKGRVLKAVYHKARNNEWDYIEAVFKKPVDTRPFRYLTVEVYGDQPLIAKLYTGKDRQEDVGVLKPRAKDAWNHLVFDMASMPNESVDRASVSKILFFIAPGRVAEGTAYLDTVRFTNTPDA